GGREGRRPGPRPRRAREARGSPRRRRRPVERHRLPARPGAPARGPEGRRLREGTARPDGLSRRAEPRGTPPHGGAMQRTITALREDAASQWVAELDCGHARHVRHAPPFAERAWTQTPETRAPPLGTARDCARCDARELPAEHREYRRTALFSEATAPAALRERHTTKAGVWARIHVVSGALGYRVLDPFDSLERLEAGAVGVV